MSWFNAKLLRWLVGLGLLFVIWVAVSLRDRVDVLALQSLIESAGYCAPLVFIVIYASATVLFLPGVVLTLLGGALFGPVWGALWSLTGATLGAALAFRLARYLGADWVRQRAGVSIAGVQDGVAREGWRFVALVRLVPLFPFVLLNYALGLTRIPFFTYVLATAVFMSPLTLAYSWLGYAGRATVTGGEDVVRTVLIALTLLALLLLLPPWIRRFRSQSRAEVLTLQLDTANEAANLGARSAPEQDARP